MRRTGAGCSLWALEKLVLVQPAMSRIPQPPSRNTARSPAKPTVTPASRLGASNVTSSTRKPPPSPTPTSRTLRPQASMKSVKPPPSPQKSPVRRTPDNPTKLNEDATAEQKTTQLSIREQIALRRAEAKKAVSKPSVASSGFDNFDGLEDALPDVKQEEGAVDLGRWSVKETIERGRSTGEFRVHHWP